jgi:hypothetical protein
MIKSVDLDLEYAKMVLGRNSGQTKNERDKNKMLTCKNVAVINSEDGKSYTAVEYDRIYLDFSKNDKIEELKKVNKKQPVQVDGKEWIGSRPVENITSEKDVTVLVQEAVNYLVSKYGDTPDFKAVSADNKGWLILLKAADYGNDLWVRAKIQTETRPKAAQDPAVALEKVLKSMVADALSRGKTLTMEQAKVRYDKLAALEAEEAA